MGRSPVSRCLRPLLAALCRRRRRPGPGGEAEGGAAVLHLAAASGTASLVVPPSAVPGTTKLAVDTGARLVQLTLPEQAERGDTLHLRLDEGGWRCDIVKPAQRGAHAPGAARDGPLRALVPGDAVPGITEVVVDTLDGHMVSVTVPKDACPGDTLLLSRARRLAEWHCSVERADRDLGPPRRASAEEDARSHAALVQAVAQAGGAWSGKLDRGTSAELQVPGVVAREAIAAGEELARTPASLFLDPAAVRGAEPRLCREIEALRPTLPKELSRQPELPAQAAFLARLLAEAELRRAAGAAQLPTPDADPRDALAQRRCDGRRPTPATGGTRAGGGAARALVWANFADHLLCETLPEHPYRRSALDPAGFRAAMSPSPEGELVERLAWTVLCWHGAIVRALPGLRPSITAQGFLHAWLLVVSRAFEVNGARTTLIPGLDCFNHRPMAAAARVRLDVKTGAMVVESTRDIAAGEEVCISYGELCNPMLHRTYGFTLSAQDEPGWTFTCLPAGVQPILRAHLPAVDAGKVIELDSRWLHGSLRAAIQACAGAGPSRGARERVREFLGQLLGYHHQRYLRDEELGAALQRSRLDVGAPLAARLQAALDGAPASDALRVKASEYLCVALHMEAARLLAEGSARGAPRPGGGVEALAAEALAHDMEDALSDASRAA